MTAPRYEWTVGSGVPERPRLLLILAIAAAAIAGTAGAILLQLDSDHAGRDPAVQISLLAWLILPYVLGGLVAWYCKPSNRFGPLMIAAGLGTLLSSFSSANANLLSTIGTAFDLLPFALFMHVFLAFPTGALRGGSERIVVGAAYAVALLDVVGLMLGGFDPDNAIAVTDAPGLAAHLLRLQLVVTAGLLLVGFVAMLSRRAAAARPLRAPVKVLVDAFSLALVLAAVLLLVQAFAISLDAFLAIQRTLFVIVGLSAIVFLLVLLDARLARASIGNLLIELRAEPPPDDLAAPLSRALHDPTLEIGFWLPEYEGWADRDGRELRSARPRDDPDRSMTLIDREGEHLAVLVHDPSLDDEPELLHAVSAAAAFALENQRLQVELKAKLKELEGSRGRVIEAGQQERKRLERNLHDGAQQRLIALSLDLGMLEGRLGEDPEARERIEAARAEIAVSLEELRASPAACTRRCSAATGSRSPCSRSSRALRSRSISRSTSTKRLEESVEVAAYYVVNESLANIGKHAAAALGRVVVIGRARAGGRDHRRRHRRGRHGERARACAGWPTGSRPSAAGCGSGRQAAAAPGCRAEMPCG